MLRKILKELVLIRKELQTIKQSLKPLNLTIDGKSIVRLSESPD